MIRAIERGETTGKGKKKTKTKKKNTTSDHDRSDAMYNFLIPIKLDSLQILQPKIQFC